MRKETFPQAGTDMIFPGSKRIGYTLVSALGELENFVWNFSNLRSHGPFRIDLIANRYGLRNTFVID